MTLLHFRQRLVFILLIFLPFHALIVTVVTKGILDISTHPLLAISLWKEGLIDIILTCILTELVFKKEQRSVLFHYDIIDALILFTTLLGIVTSMVCNVPLKQALLGFRYDFIPLLCFMIFRKARWQKEFIDTIETILLVVGLILIVYGLITLMLPMSFFRMLGYSDLHSLYDPNGALSPFQAIEGSSWHRLQSAMSGPNQLGTYLLISWSIALLKSRDGQMSWGFFGAITMIGLGILLTFSRAAWIAAIIIAFVTFCRSRKHVYAFFGIALSGIILITLLFPQSILRSASTSDHLRKPVEALQSIVKHPWGQGLGSAGPASNAVSDTCVMLPSGADPSWAMAHPQLCVFVDAMQVQPRDRACSCPTLTENW